MEKAPLHNLTVRMNVLKLSSHFLLPEENGSKSNDNY